MSRIKHFAERLSNVLSTIEDKKIDAASIVEEAKGEGINIKALKRVAKDMITDSVKLRVKLDDEEQLSLFRDEVNLLQRKGLALKEAA